ncbi:hypothetical protein F0U60_37725 [Archangium minus]|uniref:Uncharacterized protein n=1 Tax=Archangium minus TaxID=83450 RepID=A0ABY9X1E6_9BACT|nr:hypothetical protein F0U61_37310 [Archangium violaceum]WNG49224.1 hypothetical protein F0U60_37725 [Archangium minus]
MRPVERTEVNGFVVITAADSSPISRATLSLQIWEAMDSVPDEELDPDERKGRTLPAFYSAHHAP